MNTKEIFSTVLVSVGVRRVVHFAQTTIASRKNLSFSINMERIL